MPSSQRIIFAEPKQGMTFAALLNSFATPASAAWLAQDAADGSSWTDRIGGLTLTQATGSLQPVRGNVFNGYPALTADGVDDFMEVAATTGLPIGGTPGQIWVIGKYASAASTSIIAGYGVNGAAVSRQVRIAFNGGANLTDGSVTITGQNAVGNHIIGGSWSDTTINGYVDGTGFTGNPYTIATLATGATRLRFFASLLPTAAAFGNASLHAVLITPVLSAVDQARLEGWAAGRGGFQANLPSNHIYRYESP